MEFTIPKEKHTSWAEAIPVVTEQHDGGLFVGWGTDVKFLHRLGGDPNFVGYSHFKTKEEAVECYYAFKTLQELEYSDTGKTPSDWENLASRVERLDPFGLPKVRDYFLKRHYSNLDQSATELDKANEREAFFRSKETEVKEMAARVVHYIRKRGRLLAAKNQ